MAKFAACSPWDQLEAEFTFVGSDSELTSHHQLREEELTDYDFIHTSTTDERTGFRQSE